MKLILFQINFLKTFGGMDQEHAVDKIMKKLLSDELASKFSWLGRRGKSPFVGKIKILQCIKGKELWRKIIAH
jgi:hypothetical protein